MICTLAGALANLILDPVFIFPLGLGVKGAAIATVAGEIITFAMSIIYLGKSKHFVLRKLPVEHAARHRHQSVENRCMDISLQVLHLI